MPINRLYQSESTASPLPGAALWRLGFRPFYLLAALFAVISVPAWVLQATGHASLKLDLPWHMHEMVFGFAAAVIIGFLFTAGRNWTNQPTPSGAHLAALCALWLAGRCAMLASAAYGYHPALAAIDALLLPLAAWPLYRAIRRAASHRNLPIIGILALLAAFNLIFHASMLGWLALSPLAPVHGAILLITMLEAVMGGRVIPMFTANGAPGSKPRSRRWLERASLASLALAALAWLLAGPGMLAALACFAAAALHAARLLGWHPASTLRLPLLWVLHLAYGWIAGGLLLLGLASLGMGSASTAFHALAVGAMSGLIIGMVTRTALGHTARPLRAGRAETAMYLLLETGAVLRLCANLANAGSRNQVLLAAAACWSLSFLLYLIVYAPYLSRPRLDGRDG
ncbi:NnrS family protein [Pseudoduganella rhizocola]|uniref:NnrS family protein n=1 Tax=Pseudoduganella rhizocola TaxID=3382643 RepID=UPI0038B4DCC1